jgi:LemA protein
MDSEYLKFYLIGSIAFVFASVSIYNRFIKYKNMIEESWSGIDIALKRRFNLIPNMINAVKLYSKHEADLLTKVSESRHGSTGIADRTAEESAVTQSLQGLLAIAEAYPDLKASQNFLALQHSLADVENEIMDARSVFNAAVRKNNTLVQSFPSNIIAKLFGFRNAQYFALELATQRAVPEVK